jgi:carbon-monoxide dehydrogenase medium subunit
MKAADFSYHEATNIQDAINIKAKDEEAVILAGGQSLLPALNMRLSSPSCLIDISKISGLDDIKIDGDYLFIGALATHSHVMNSELVLKQMPCLIDILKMVAHPAIRNKGTHGGSIAYGDPAAELPALAVATNAEIIVSGQNGDRSIHAKDFYLGLFETAINQDEIVIGIKYPLLKQEQAILFDEVCRRHGDYAMAGLIANVNKIGNKVNDLSLVYFATGDKPDSADKTAKLYLENGYDYSNLKNSLNSEIDFAGDLNSSSEMKLHLATILIKKVLNKLEA